MTIPEKIPFGERWLLEAAVRCGLQLRAMAWPEKQIKLWLNYGNHGMDASELRLTLKKLFAEGDIIARSESRGQFVPSDDELELALNQDRDKIKWDDSISYQLTPQGGSRWERMAAPNWERFFRDTSPDDWPDDSVEIIAGSKQRRQELMEHADLLWDFTPDWSTVVQDEILPWQATDWKELATGFRARFRYERCGWPPVSPRDLAKYCEVRHWANSILGYKNL